MITRESSANLLSTLLALFFFLISISSFSQSKKALVPLKPSLFATETIVGCSLFSDPANYVTGNHITFNAPVNNNSNFSAPVGTNFGCIYSAPNQVWVVITVTSPGNMHFVITNSNNVDVDAVVWGPVPNADMSNACSVTSNYPLTCDYDAYRPDLFINGASVGQKYLMLVTNYSNYNTSITLSQPTGGGTVNYSVLNLPNCSILPTASISGTVTSVPEGSPVPLTINFTGTAPWNYLLSDGTRGTATTSPHNLNVYPTAESTTYTIASVSNACGTSSGSGSVGVSTTRNVIHKTCFPLDGDALDSKSLNNGTLFNGVTAAVNRSSEANNALSFDGVDDFVSFPTNQLRNTTFTFSAWVKAETLPSGGNPEIIFASFGYTLDEHFLGIENINNQNLWKFASNGTSAYSVTEADNNWHHITALRNGGQVKIYIDGILEGSITNNNPASFDNNAIGLLGKGISGKHFNGKIDDVKIFQGTLLDPEIELLNSYSNCNNVYDDSYIYIQSLSTSVICNNTSLTLRATTNNLLIESGVQFIVELSDVNGSFASPTVIGNSQFLPVNLAIPGNTLQGFYKIRLRYAGQLSLNEVEVFVNNAGTYTLSGGTTITDGQSTTLNIDFTGTGPWYYTMNNGLSGVATTSPWQISVTPDQNTVYTVNSSTNICGNMSSGNSSTAVLVNFVKENISCFPFTNDAIDEKSNNTTTINGPLLTENRFGQVNKAYQFDGSNDFIGFTTNELRKREYSYSAWVLMSAIPTSDKAIISLGSYANNNYQELAASPSGWKFTSVGSNGGYYINTNNFFAANQWVHLTVVRSYQSLRIYVNGLLSVVGNNTARIDFKPEDLGRIGSNVSSNGSFFNGKIDDVRLYRGALNDDEVYALYASLDNCPVVENKSIIITREVNPTTACAGSNIYVSFTSSNVNISPTFPIQIQLSDQYGSFATSTVIGSGTTSPVTASLPLNIAGNFYRVRAVPTDPGEVMIVNSQGLIISGTYPTATLSGGGSIETGGSADLIIDFTGTPPWTYAINNGVSVTTNTSPDTVSVSPYSSTVYSITSIINQCGNGSASGQAQVIVPSVVSINTFNQSSVCGGSQFNLSYTANYSSGGFVVQLSDAVGDFSNALNIGSGNLSPISILIPDTLLPATGYRLRIGDLTEGVFSTPTTAFEIKKPLVASISGNAVIYDGFSSIISLDFDGSSPFNYTLSDGRSGSTSQSHLELPFDPGFNYTVTLSSVSNSCGVGIKSGSASIQYQSDPVQFVSCYSFSGNSNDSKSSFHLANTNATYTLNRLGQASKALYFNGNAYAANTTFPVPLNPNVSYSFWIRPSAAFTNRVRLITISGETLYLKGGGGQPYTLQFDIGTPFLPETYLPFYTPETIAAGITLNTWSHIVITNQSDFINIFVNGVNILSYNLEVHSAQNGLYLAGKSTDYEKFVGMIDDVQIFNDLIYQDRVRQLYTYGIDCENFFTLPEIKMNTATPLTVCSGSSITLNYATTNLILTNQEPLKFELSDASGSFSNPILLTSTLATSGNLAVSLPAGLVAGSSYKLRLKTDSYSTGPTYSTIIQTPVSASLTGATTIEEGDIATLNLSFSGSLPPFQYKINNGPLTTANTENESIPVNPTESTNYTITQLTNGCGAGTFTNDAFVTVTPKPIRQISCFPFNGNLNDSRMANTVTNYGATLTTGKSNLANQAYYFDGINDYMLLTSNNVFNPDFTISTWFNISGPKEAAMPNDFVIFQFGYNTFNYSTQHAFRIYFEPDMGFGPEAFYLKLSANGTGTHIHLPDFHYNQWNHAVLVHSAGSYKVFLNGQLLASLTGAITNINFPSNSNIYLGASQDGSVANGNLKGKIESFELYKGTLTNGQVGALFNSSSDCFDATTYTCVSDHNLTTLLSGTNTYQSGNSINGNSVINAGSNIYFDAKNTVLLQPGFETKSNVIFRATAGGGCEN